MKQDQGWKLRLAVLSTLVKQAQHRPGRTAMMKFAYLLQTIKGVPLNYRFELYNYGPYDSTVLSDLSEAVTLKTIKSQMVNYPSGYGFEYSTNEKGYSALAEKLGEELSKYQGEIRWVLDQFGNASASRLELVSTVVFAEREMRRKHQMVENAELCRRVKSIKPHFSEEVISTTVDELREMQLITVAR